MRSLACLILCCICAVVCAEPIKRTDIEAYYKAEMQKPADQRKHPRLSFADPKIGDTGILPYAFDPRVPTEFVTTSINNVRSEQEMVVDVQTYKFNRTLRRVGNQEVAGPATPEKAAVIKVLMRGLSTAGQVDGKQFQVGGGFTISTTEKVDGSTIYVFDAIQLPSLKD